MARIGTPSAFYPEKKVYAYQTSDGLRKHSYFYWKHGKPVTQLHTVAATGLTTITCGVATETDLVNLGDGVVLERYNGTTQDIGSLLNDAGLNIACDLTSNDRVEYVPGGNYAANPYRFTTPSSKTAFFRVRLKVSADAGLDNTFIGWRKQEAYGAMTVKSATDPVYTEFVGFGLPEGGTAGVVYVASDVADSGTPSLTSTGFDFGNNGIVDFEVRMNYLGAKFFINGYRLGDTISKNADGTAITAQETVAIAGPTLTTATTFIPTIVLQQTATTANVFLRELECGLLVDAGLDATNQRA